MTPRPPFTLRELRRMAVSLWHIEGSVKRGQRIIFDNREYAAARDAAAFARLRGKVVKMVEGMEKKR